MRFGMNLLLWSGGLNEELVPVIESLKEMGYDGVEVPLFDYDVDFAPWGERLAAMGMGVTAVTVRNLDDNPISSDKSVRDRGVALNKKAIDCCDALGATHLIGPYHSAIGHFSGSGPTTDEWNWGVDSMRQVADHAESAGVVLGVEALNRFECYLLNTHRDAARFAREVGSENCRCMFDTFHCNIEEKTFAQGIRDCGDMLCHVHISENDRSIPGTGHVNWTETFDTLKAVGYDGWLMIEAFGLALPEIAAATKIWRKMYSDELTLASEGLAFMKSEYAKRWR